MFNLIYYGFRTFSMNFFMSRISCENIKRRQILYFSEREKSSLIRSFLPPPKMYASFLDTFWILSVSWIVLEEMLSFDPIYMAQLDRNRRDIVLVEYSYYLLLPENNSVLHKYYNLTNIICIWYLCIWYLLLEIFDVKEAMRIKLRCQLKALGM